MLGNFVGGLFLLGVESLVYYLSLMLGLYTVGIVLFLVLPSIDSAEDSPQQTPLPSIANSHDVQPDSDPRTFRQHPTITFETDEVPDPEEQRVRTGGNVCCEVWS